MHVILNDLQMKVIIFLSELKTTRKATMLTTATSISNDKLNATEQVPITTSDGNEHHTTVSDGKKATEDSRHTTRTSKMDAITGGNKPTTSRAIPLYIGGKAVVIITQIFFIKNYQYQV